MRQHFLETGFSWGVGAALTVALAALSQSCPGKAGGALNLDLAETPMQLPQADRPLAERFADPPAESRILKIIHSWPDDPAAQEALIRRLISQGFGGVVCNVSFTDYLESEEKWQAFVRAVHRAKEAGMALWLYDEKGYPSGTAGGLTLRDHPEWQARGLLIAEAISVGGPVALDLPPGQLHRASAFPLQGGHIQLDRALNLAGQVQAGKLTWQAPESRWWVVAITESFLYEGTHSSVSVGDRRPDINLLMPEPTARFLEVTHGRYAAHLGPDLGRWFVSTFTDEPSLMSLFLRPMPYCVLPWAPALPEEFRRRRGYELEPVIPHLLAEAGGSERKVRYDFWQTVAELVAENFFGQIQQFCRRHGVLSGGHLLMEESLLAHVPLYGDFFRCLRYLDAPSMDCLTSVPSEVPWFIARLISSAADLEGRTVTMCEASDFAQVYRPAGDTRPGRQVTAEEIRGTCNRLLLGGIHTITSYYTFKGLSGEQLQSLNLWVGRCSTMLAGGPQVTDLVVLYPIESLWPRFVPARHGATDSANAAAVEQAYANVHGALYEANRDFTFVDGRTLAQAQVEGGVLRHRKLTWRVVILPGADTLPLAAWENLARFWRQGGAVIAVAALPAHSESEFPCRHVQALAEEMFGRPQEPHVHANAAGGVGVYLPPGAEALLPTVLDALLEPDVKVSGPRAPVRATHRRVEGQEVYFLINDSPAPWQGSVSLAAVGPGERWDPASGTRTEVASAEAVPLSLEAYGGVLLRFPTARLPRRFSVGSGPLPGLAWQPLPAVEPSVGKGEFVQAQVTPDPEHRREGRPVWRAVGTLTKGHTDTFLFLALQYPQGLDLSQTSCLAVESWVPEGQQTSAKLLLILVEKNGGQYLADTGRSLGSPGYFQAYVPWSRFTPADWAPDPDGRLDLAHIAALNIGWGGYLGSEGERVEFSLALPQCGR